MWIYPEYIYILLVVVVVVIVDAVVSLFFIHGGRMSASCELAE